MNEKMPPGWYNDPSGTNEVKRYWDGGQWTQMVQGESQNQGRESTAAVADAAKSVSSGIISVILGLFGLVVNIAVGVLIISAIATYIFNLGGWKIGGMRVFDILQFALLATVILCFINYAIVKPISALYRSSSLKGILDECFSVSGVTDAEEREEITYTKRFVRRYLNITTTSALVSSWISCLLAFFAHDPMMEALGNPWADILTIAIMFIGMRVISLIFAAGPMGRMQKEDSETFALVTNMFDRAL